MSFQLAFIGMPGPMELTVILCIMLLLFGKKLPSVMRSLGSSVVSFKKGLNEVEDIPRDIEKAVDDAVKKE